MTGQRARPPHAVQASGLAGLATRYHARRLDPTTAVQLAHAEHAGGAGFGDTPADAAVWLCALSCVAAAHDDLDARELAFIDAARAAGATWYQIGLAMGYAGHAAKQGAQIRHRRLHAATEQEVGPDARPHATTARRTGPARTPPRAGSSSR